MTDDEDICKKHNIELDWQEYRVCKKCFKVLKKNQVAMNKNDLEIIRQLIDKWVKLDSMVDSQKQDILFKIDRYLGDEN